MGIRATTGRAAQPRLVLPLAAALLAALIAILAPPALRPDPAGAAGGKPNVVVVLTDDMTLRDYYETRQANGRGRKLMRYTRGLVGRRGVTFSRYYSSNSISCPSRTTNLTGQYSRNHGITKNNWGPRKYCSDPGRINLSTTLPVWLRAAGYRTLHYGRFLNAHGLGRPERVPPGWDTYVQPVETNVSSTAVFWGYRLNVNGTITGKIGSRKTRERKAYFTDRMVNMALADIASDTSKPFYLQLDHRAPHEDTPKPVGPDPATRHNKILRGEKPRTPRSFNEANVRDKTRWLRKSRRLNGKQMKLISVRNRRRLRSLASVDDGVKRIVSKLKALGELNNTYIVFTSDNGFFNGEHRISKGKFRPYENSSHVPFAIRGPGIKRGAVSRELVANVDLAPTIVQIAGAKATRKMDGRSLLPFARKPRRRSRRPIFLESYPPRPGESAAADAAAARISPYGGEQGGTAQSSSSGHFGPIAFPAADPTPPNWRGIVFGRYKLARFKGQGFELYDLRRDPHEVQSIARNSRYRPVFKFLRKRLKVLERCSGKACRRPIKGKLPRPRGR